MSVLNLDIGIYDHGLAAKYSVGGVLFCVLLLLIIDVRHQTYSFGESSARRSNSMVIQHLFNIDNITVSD